MKILLTGASGFIGKNLKEAWTGKYDLRAPSHSELDLLDSEEAEKYLKKEKFDVVVHSANTNNVVHAERADNMLDLNLRMFCNLKRCSGLYGKMYYFGSGAEYDMRHYIPLMPEIYFGQHIPQDAYGFSKYIMSEMASGNIYDLRLFGVFGPHEEWRRRFISNMIYQNMNGGTMRMGKDMYFDYIYIKDLIRILDWFLFNVPKYNHYNVCTGKSIRLTEIAKIILSAAGGNGEIISEPGMKPEYSGDNSRLTEETGGFSLTPLTAAVKEMIEFYKANGFS